MFFKMGFPTIFVLAAFTTVIRAQSFHIGKCPETSVKANFDPLKFSGTWYEIKHTRRINPFEAFKKCVRFDFSDENYGVVSIESLKVGNFFNDKNYDIETITPVEPGHYVSSTYDYKVIASDYINYAVIFACYEGVLTRTELIWIFSRTPGMSVEMDSIIMDGLEKAGISTQDLKATLQDCDSEDNEDNGDNSDEGDKASDGSS